LDHIRGHYWPEENKKKEKEDWYTVKKEREFRRDRVQNHIQYDEGLPP
jgi:hypothetical protein